VEPGQGSSRDELSSVSYVFRAIRAAQQPCAAQIPVARAGLSRPRDLSKHAGPEGQPRLMPWFSTAKSHQGPVRADAAKMCRPSPAGGQSCGLCSSVRWVVSSGQFGRHVRPVRGADGARREARLGSRALSDIKRLRQGGIRSPTQEASAGILLHICARRGGTATLGVFGHVPLHGARVHFTLCRLVVALAPIPFSLSRRLFWSRASGCLRSVKWTF